VPKRDPLIAQVRDLEKRVEKLENELADFEKHILEKLARMIHGPSQPPPPG
jgi:vacuolar-type H+-ATPase subunit D/Vma8